MCICSSKRGRLVEERVRVAHKHLPYIHVHVLYAYPHVCVREITVLSLFIRRAADISGYYDGEGGEGGGGRSDSYM